MEGVVLDEVFREAVGKALAPEAVQAMVDEQMSNAVAESIKRCIGWGEARKALDAKVSEMLVPAIERYDLSRCNVKLELLLDELVQESAIAERRQLLSNFKRLMSTRDLPESVSATHIAGRWERWVAENFDCDGRHVTDGSYEEFEAYEVVRIHDSYSRIFFHATISLDVEPDENGNEQFNRVVHLTRYHHDSFWTVDLQGRLNVSDLQYMSDFDVWLYTISLAQTQVELDLAGKNVEYIQPASEPEYELR